MVGVVAKRPPRTILELQGGLRVFENNQLDDVVGTVCASDDPNLSGRYTYSLADDAGGKFSIVNPSLGVVLAEDIFDYEVASTYSLTVRAQAAGRPPVFGVVTVDVIDVNESPFALVMTPRTTATQGTAYGGFTITATGGTPPVTYSVGSGSLPAGITVSSSASVGTVAGTPTVAGTFPNIVMRGTDSLGATANAAPFTLTVTPLVTGVFTVADTALTFGALTLANAGGYQVVANRPIAAASITGGTLNDTHTKISATGMITRDVNGWSSGTIIISCTADNAEVDTATLTVTALADTYDIRSAPECLAANNILRAGVAVPMTLRLAEDCYITPFSKSWFNSSQTHTALRTITSRDETRMGTFECATGTNLDCRISPRYFDFHHVRFVALTARSAIGSLAYCILLSYGASCIGPFKIRHCECTPTPWMEIGPGQQYRSFFGSSGSVKTNDWEFSDNDFHDCKKGIHLNFGGTSSTGRLDILRNSFTEWSSDAIVLGGDPGVLVIEDNLVHRPFVDTERILFHANSYQQRPAGLTGAVDQSKCLFFTQLMPDSTSSQIQLFSTGNYAAGLSIIREVTTKQVICTVKSAAGATILTLTSARTMDVDLRYDVLVSIDTAGTSRMWMWRENDDGTGVWAQEATAAAAGGTAIDLTGDTRIGGTVNGSSYRNCVLFWQGIAPDISQQSVRDTFVYPTTDATNAIWNGYHKPVPDIIAAYGTPLIAFYGPLYPYWRPGQNRGTGGSFTIGPLTTSIEVTHGDLFQWVPKTNISNGFQIRRNVFLSARDDFLRDTQFDDHLIQGLFLEDIGLDGTPDPPSWNYYDGIIEKNLVVTGITVHGVALYNAYNCIIRKNTTVQVSTWETEGATSIPLIHIDENYRPGVPMDHNSISDNVAYSSTSVCATGGQDPNICAAGGPSTTITNNFRVYEPRAGNATPQYTFSQVFQGIGGAQPFTVASIAEALQAFSPIVGGVLDLAGAGAVTTTGTLKT